MGVAYPSKVGNATPLVSVLMTTYRHERYIGQAIESVLAQQCDFPFEIVVGEDCSPDRTRAIVQSFVELYPDIVRVVYGEANLGLAKNTKYTFDACLGKYVAFCEGDDWWIDPHKLQKQIEKFSDQQVGMVHCGYVVAKPAPNGCWELSGGAHSLRAESDLRGCNLFSTYLKELVPRLSASVYRRELLERYYRSRLGCLEYVTTDLPMTVFAAAESCIEYVSDIGTVYRHAPQSITRSGLKKTIVFLDGVSRIFLDIQKLYGKRDDFDNLAWAWVPTAQARAAFRLNDTEAFNSAINRLQAIDPKKARTLPIALRRALMKSPMLVRSANWLLDVR